MSAMTCPQCGKRENDILDSRPSGDEVIRRRRRCLSCDHRFTTYEIHSTVFVTAIERNNQLAAARRALIDEFAATLPMLTGGPLPKLKPR